LYLSPSAGASQKMDSSKGRTRVTIDLTDDSEAATLVEPGGHSWKASVITEVHTPSSGAVKYPAISLAGRNPQEKNVTNTGSPTAALGSQRDEAQSAVSCSPHVAESSSQPLLSKEVRDKIAKNKADALARRAAALEKKAELPGKVHRVNT
jgi:hypothetical protein